MRHEDWPEILAAEIQTAKDKPFKWGRCDCVMWAAAVVAAITSEDYAKEWRGTYSTELGAGRVKKKHMPQGMRGVLDSKFPRVPIAGAKRGDFVLKMVDGQEAVGICLGMPAAFKAPVGLTLVRTLDCECAWEVL